MGRAGCRAGWEGITAWIRKEDGLHRAVPGFLAWFQLIFTGHRYFGYSVPKAYSNRQTHLEGGGFLQTSLLVAKPGHLPLSLYPFLQMWANIDPSIFYLTRLKFSPWEVSVASTRMRPINFLRLLREAIYPPGGKDRCSVA